MMFDSIASASTAFSKWLDKDANLAVFLIGLVMLLVVFQQGGKLVRKIGSALFGATGVVTRHPHWTTAGFALAGTAIGTFVAWRHLLSIDPFGVLTEPMVMGATAASGLILGLFVGALIVRLNGRYHHFTAADRRRTKASAKSGSVADVYRDREETPFYGPRQIRQDVFKLYQVDGKMPPEMVESYQAEVNRRIAELNDGKRGQFAKADTDQAIQDRIASKFRMPGMSAEDLFGNTAFVKELMAARAARDERYGIGDQTVARNS